MRILEVPLLEPDSFLTIDVASDLANDPSELCQLLADEKCASKWWLAIAASYAQKDMLDAAEQVVKTGLNECFNLKEEEQKADFYQLLGWIQLHRLRRAKTSMKTQFYEEAIQTGNSAFQSYQQTKSDPRVVALPAVLLQGALYLAVGNVNDALPCFQTVLQTQPANVYAKLGRARVLYARKNYRQALKVYQEVLKQAPKTRVGFHARTGMGICFFKLKDFIKATKCWERNLNLKDEVECTNYDLGVVYSLMGLSRLTESFYGQQSSFSLNYTDAINFFQTAFKLGVKALPALKIAGYLFSKHDMGLVGKLTDDVLETASIPEILAEAMFWKGRAAHYAQDLDLALTLYTQAANANPQNVAASIGKGIIELCQNRHAEALLTLELVVQHHPKNVSGLLYAGLFSAKHEPKKARQLLENYVQLNQSQAEPLNYEALVTLSELWEGLDPVKALAYLRQAQSLLPQTPKELYINIGCLEFAVGNYKESLANFNAVEDKDDLVRYNLNRAREALGESDVDEIINEYAKLPVLEAAARLTLINDTDAVSKTEQLVQQFPNNMELRALLAYHLRNAKRTSSNHEEISRKEQELLKATLTKFNKHDTYSLTSLGNIYLQLASTLKSDPSRQNRSFQRAAELFEKVLKIDKNNAYAAQGVAIGLVYTRNSKLAQNIFSRLRETLPTNKQTIVNSAHCLMDAGDFTRASELYLQAYTANKSKQLAQLLGWSWFMRGMRHKDVNALSQSLKWTLESLEEGDAVSEFNHALVELQLGDMLRRQTADSRTLEQLVSAKEGVEHALKVFQQFVESKPETIHFDSSDIDEKADHAEHTVLPQLQTAIEEQRLFEVKAEERRLQAVKQREEELKLVQAAKEQAEKERIAREEELKLERIRLQQEAMEWEAQRQAQRESLGHNDEEKKSKKKNKKNKKKDTDSEEEKEFSEHDSDKEEKENQEEEGEENKEEEEEKVERKTVVDDDSDDDLF